QRVDVVVYRGNTVFAQYTKADMMTKTTVHTVRLDDKLTQRLDDEAKRQRMATGDSVTKADVIRAALVEFLKAKG
ncbi:MAG: hypothetical protein ACTH5D_16220, partial [Halomonas sp.]|uniref:hypothetical protein n=1 Tax=Halomonas sp. TaxID=1486246 RepID=UPI003F906344